MIQIDNTIISDLLIEEKFVCDLEKCKGQCCIQGDSGAPLEDFEADILDDLYPVLKPYLRQEGIEAIEKEGKYYVDDQHELVTQLIDGGECAYVVFESNGIAKCGIEKAWLDKKIDFRKPISCFLYPVRTKKFTELEAVNFDEWDICKPALENGEKADVAVYQFLKAPLIEKYGQQWYSELEGFAKEIKERKNNFK